MTGDEISNGSFEEEKYNDSPDPERRLSNNNGDQEFESNSAAELLRDPHGLPLVPQPSRFKDDPLVSKFPMLPRQNMYIFIAFHFYIVSSLLGFVSFS